jgi:Spy/CpxP family protein refolding chaperone
MKVKGRLEMGKAALVALAIALGAGTVAAQGPESGGGRRGMMMMSLEDLSARLQLDSSQVTKIKPMLEKFAAETKGARDALRANMQAVRNGEKTREAVSGENQAAMVVIREHLDVLNKDIRTCLTPEQQKTFDAWVAERAERMKQMGRPPN